MKKYMLLTLVLLGLSIAGCGGTSTKTPDGTIQLLFKNVRAGEISAAKTLLLNGFMGEYGENQLRKIFGSEDVTAIQTEVLTDENLRATVLITLVTKSGNRKGKRPVKLVFQDGGWKIDPGSKFFPKTLTTSNY